MNRTRRRTHRPTRRQHRWFGRRRRGEPRTRSPPGTSTEAPSVPPTPGTPGRLQPTFLAQAILLSLVRRGVALRPTERSIGIHRRQRRLLLKGHLVGRLTLPDPALANET